MLEVVKIVGAVLRRRRRGPDLSRERILDHGEITDSEMALAPEVSYEDEYGRRVSSEEYQGDDVLDEGDRHG
jgi:hypothetical protein